MFTALLNGFERWTSDCVLVTSGHADTYFFSTDGRGRGPGIIIPGVQGLFWVIELCELKSFRGGVGCMGWGQRIEQSGLFIL